MRICRVRQVQGNVLYTSCGNCLTLEWVANPGRDIEPWELSKVYSSRVNGLYAPKNRGDFIH